MNRFLSMMLVIMRLALPGASLVGFDTDLLAEQKALTFSLTCSDADIVALEMAAGEKVDEDQAAYYAMMSDVLNTMGLTNYSQHPSADCAQFGYTMSLNGQDAVTLESMYQKGDLYIASNLLGQDTILVTSDQLTATMEELKAQVIAQNGAGSQLEKQIDDAMDQMKHPDEFFNRRKASNDLDTMKLTNFLSAFEKTAEKAEKADASTAPAGSDKAESAITLKLSKEDVTTLLQAFVDDFEATNYGAACVESLNQTLSSSDQLPTVDDIIEFMCDQIKDDTVVTLYTDTDGNMVSATMKVALLEEVDLDLVILSSKVDDLQKVTVIATTTEGDALAKMNGTIQTTADKHVTVDVKLDVTDGDDKYGMSFLVTAAETKNSLDVQVKLTSLDGAATYLSIFMNYALADIKPAVNTANAMQPLAMSEEEKQTWATSLQNDMQMGVAKIIQNLPPSVLLMMIQQQ